MTIFTITYNESLILPFFIKHYRDRFPGCRIVIYDNHSTDDTATIAKMFECEIIPYDTGGKLSDTKYLEIKNNCWKLEDGWVIVADCDELLDINEDEIKRVKATIINPEAYNMVAMDCDEALEQINHGVRSTSYDKLYCFNASKLNETNYAPGAHSCSPIGEVTYTEKKYKLYHYKYINAEYMIARHAEFAKRLSDENIKKGYGAHYLYPPEQIKKEFLNARLQAIKLF
jgi:glycosyltransferase involved in cell wall biosynthesis